MATDYLVLLRDGWRRSRLLGAQRVPPGMLYGVTKGRQVDIRHESQPVAREDTMTISDVYPHSCWTSSHVSSNSLDDYEDISLMTVKLGEV